jgi:hypothetical protein
MPVLNREDGTSRPIPRLAAMGRLSGVTMRSTSVALFVAALLGAAGGAARADPARPGLAADNYSAGSDFGFQSSPNAPSSRLRTLEWDSKKGRWGLKLDVEQHLEGDAHWNDVQPGVFFKVTPRLHIGGGLSLTPAQAGQPNLATPPEEAPRVRLETTFKF